MRQSDAIDQLAAALTAALAELRNPPRSATNPFFNSKYAPLDATLDLVRPVLAKHGLSAIQSAQSVDGHPAVVTRLLHSSGQWIESEAFCSQPTRKDKDGQEVVMVDDLSPQACGAAITYARRYQLEAILCITGDTDDDGSAASGHHDTRSASTSAKPPTSARTKPRTAPQTRPAAPGATPAGQAGQSPAPRCIDRTDEHTTFSGLQVRYVTDKAVLLADPTAADEKGVDSQLKVMLPRKAIVPKHSGELTKGCCIQVCVLNWAIKGDEKNPPKQYLVDLIHAAEPPVTQDAPKPGESDRLPDDDIPF